MTNLPGQKILVIDIGGSHIKATMLDEAGVPLIAYQKITTPVPASPDSVVAAIQTLIKNFPTCDKVSVGFPGYIKDGNVKTAPNLDQENWKDVNFVSLLSNVLKKPVKLVNDADLQGLGLVSGKGLEMVITLGTGFGTALLLNGKLLPHLELAHHPITKKKTYDEYVGEKALQKKGLKKWNRRVKKVLRVLQTVFNYDHLYISGGNAVKLKFKLDQNITIDGNKDGIKGGAKLWIEGTSSPQTYASL